MSADTVLLIDNSNTRTKFTFARGGVLTGEVLTLPTASLSCDAVRALLRSRHVAQAVLCSVVPRTADILLRSLDCPTHRISADSCPHLLRRYPGAASLGADRIANAAAIAAFYPLPCVAIDPGTACTFDTVVEEEGMPLFLGGVIAPGLLAMAAAPARSTACLPPTDADFASARPAAIGRDTQSALRAGLYYGYTGMLSGILRSIASQLGTMPSVVITGGDADLWPEETCAEYTIDKNLTFKGMLHIFESRQEAFFKFRAN